MGVTLPSNSETISIDLREACNILGSFYTNMTIPRDVFHPPIQWVPGALPTEIKRPEREADHTQPSSSVVIKNMWRYTSTPQCNFTAWCL